MKKDEKPGNKVAVFEKNETAVSQKQDFQVTVLDLNKPLPDLNKAQAVPLDLMADYWTPENVGESKRVIFAKIDTRQVLDQQTGELIGLECAFFLEKVNDEAQMISNGSKRLVGAIASNGIMPGTPLIVTYKGKKRNRTNQYSSDNWSIKPLIINLN